MDAIVKQIGLKNNCKSWINPKDFLLITCWYTLSIKWFIVTAVPRACLELVTTYMYSMLNTCSAYRKLNESLYFTGATICKTIKVKTWQPANLARQSGCLAWIVRKWPEYVMHLGYNIMAVVQRCRHIVCTPLYFFCPCLTLIVTDNNFLLTMSIHCQEIKLWELVKWSPKRKCLDFLSNSLN